MLGKELRSNKYIVKEYLFSHIIAGSIGFRHLRPPLLLQLALLLVHFWAGRRGWRWQGGAQVTCYGR